MKKRFCMMLAAAAMVLFCMIGYSPAVSAERQYEDCIPNCGFYDIDGVFPDETAEMLSQTVLEASGKIDMYAAVFLLDDSGSSMSDSAVEQYADSKYNDLFNPQYGVDTDGILLVLNLPTHYMYISTSGMGQLYYYNGSSDNRIDAMLDNMRSYLQQENYSGAVNRFCTDLVHYYERGIPNGAYHRNSDTGEYTYLDSNGNLVVSNHLPRPWGKLIGIGAVVGVVTGLVAFLIIRSKYKLVKSLNPTNYISQQDTQFTVRDDIFLRTHTSKVRIDSGGSGGGGGGSSHMSGGHSHGGGGGHW